MNSLLVKESDAKDDVICWSLVNESALYHLENNDKTITRFSVLGNWAGAVPKSRKQVRK